MKYVLIIGDGMADDPLAELGGKTPLEACRKPFFDSLCERGELGLCQTIPEGFPPGSDTAIMGIFGCDPRKYFSGACGLGRRHARGRRGLPLQHGEPRRAGGRAL